MAGMIAATESLLLFAWLSCLRTRKHSHCLRVAILAGAQCHKVGSSVAGLSALTTPFCFSRAFDPARANTFPSPLRESKPFGSASHICRAPLGAHAHRLASFTSAPEPSPGTTRVLHRSFLRCPAQYFLRSVCAEPAISDKSHVQQKLITAFRSAALLRLQLRRLRRNSLRSASPLPFRT
jgi:hypothetical protein